MMPIFFSRGSTANCLPTNPNDCGWRLMWQFATYPYIKNWNIMTGPGDAESGIAARNAA